MRGRDTDYHLRRAAQERAAAAAAGDPLVRRIHLRLADYHTARGRGHGYVAAMADPLISAPPKSAGRVVLSNLGEAEL